ncbi:MAG: hypothetical protein RML94_11760 [Bacteroidia bacterium]|nr:hypothetical protein [Bacteroidia bacterium]
MGRRSYGVFSRISGSIKFFISSGDIVNSTATIANNQTTPVDVVGMVFSNAETRSARISYQVKRSVTGTTLIQSGTIFLDYNPQLSNWILTHDYTAGDAGVSFSVLASGQVQYTSSNLTGAGYQGEIIFNAKTLPV